MRDDRTSTAGRDEPSTAAQASTAVTGPTVPPATRAVPHRATAQRPPWHALPGTVRAAIESRAGAAVLRARSQDGGFTEGFASRLDLSDGTRLFVKAASATRGGHAHDAYRHESRVAALLPDAVPAPRLLWTLDVADWLVLAFEDVECTTPQRPWQPRELDAVLSTLGRLADVLTPAPEALLPLSTTADLDGDLGFWRRCAAGGDDTALVPAPWRARVDELADLESTWAAAAAGVTAVHFDLRDDNVLLTADGRVLVCDWNWVVLAAPWVDLVGLLVSVHGDGLDAEGIAATHPLTRDVPRASVDAFLVGLAGYFVGAAGQPTVASSPWLRVHQAWWRDAALDWLGDRLAR